MAQAPDEGAQAAAPARGGPSDTVTVRVPAPGPGRGPQPQAQWPARPAGGRTPGVTQLAVPGRASLDDTSLYFRLLRRRCRNEPGGFGGPRRKAAHAPGCRRRPGHCKIKIDAKSDDCQSGSGFH